MHPPSLTADRFVLAGAVVLTAVLFTARAADPVNVVKLTALALCALVLLVLAAARVIRRRELVLPTGPAAWAALALLAGLVVAALTAPVTTTAVLGAYGRNSGLLAYTSAIVLFLVGLRVLDLMAARFVVAGVVLAGLFTSTYGLLQYAGLDRISWANPFNPIIAALGNPNFAAGYMGAVVPVALAGGLWAGWATGWRTLCWATAWLCLVVSVASESVQGPVSAAAGLAVVALAVLLGTSGSLRRRGLVVYGVVVGLGAGALVVGAATRSGPIGSAFQGISYDARNWYWEAAVDMFRSRPLTGVGLDHYGARWRLFRPDDSFAGLGGDSFSDAAHSVPLQMLAQGGLVLAVPYLAFVVAVGASLVLGLRRPHGGERLLLGGLGGGWAAYQVQSLVSIDQTPLITLHLVLAAAVVAVAGGARLRTLRLPGAASTGPTGDDVDGPTPPPPATRRPGAVDHVLVGVVVLAGLAAGWTALTPMRATVAVMDGDTQRSAADPDAAVQSYRHAAALVPGQALHWHRLGALHVEQGEPERAYEAYLQAVEHDPLDAFSTRRAAELAEEQDDVETARSLHRRAVELDPTGTATLAAAAEFGLRHSDAATARQLLEGAVTRTPSDASLWAALGDARAVLDDPEGARAAYARALEIDPGDERAAQGLAEERS